MALEELPMILDINSASDPGSSRYALWATLKTTTNLYDFWSLWSNYR